MNTSPRIYPFSRNSNDSAGFKTVNSTLLALVAAVALMPSPAQAANLLGNPSFERNSAPCHPSYRLDAVCPARGGGELLD